MLHERRAICTLATQEMDDIFRLTKNAMKKYADRCGADLIVQSAAQVHPPHFAKYSLFCDLAAEAAFDRVLYLDADVYCRKSAEDIFDTYKFSAARPEIPHPRPYTIRKSVEWIRKHCGAPDWPAAAYVNTGVLLFESQTLAATADILDHVSPKKGRFFEQDQLNWVLFEAGFPHNKLKLSWNAPIGPAWVGLVGDYRDVRFIHGNGVPSKEKYSKLKHFIEKYP